MQGAAFVTERLDQYVVCATMTETDHHTMQTQMTQKTCEYAWKVMFMDISGVRYPERQ